MTPDIDYSPVVVDVETCPLANATDYIDPPETPDLSGICAPSNYKDPAKIAAYVEDAKAKKIAEHNAEMADYLAGPAKAALDWNVGRIAAIGAWTEDRGALAYPCLSEHDEADALAAFWETARRRTIVGFNIKGFDLRFMVQRSRYLGVSHPILDFSKYSRRGITDLYLDLTFGDGTYDQGCMRRTLKAFCKRFGMPVEDSIDGKDIPALVAAGEWDKVIAHVKSDVALTLALARKLGVVNEAREVAEVL